ncbi:MAG: hypothetical protein MJA29_13335, partial [Candidatus Omnitrophica bacterium]|nr:hypothetical protein [Candidatus Omnitrophota bacterium]
MDSWKKILNANTDVIIETQEKTGRSYTIPSIFNVANGMNSNTVEVSSSQVLLVKYQDTHFCMVEDSISVNFEHYFLQQHWPPVIVKYLSFTHQGF